MTAAHAHRCADAEDAGPHAVGGPVVVRKNM